MKFGITLNKVKKTSFKEIPYTAEFVNTITGEILPERQFKTAQYTYTVNVSYSENGETNRVHEVKLTPISVYISEPTENPEYNNLSDKTKLLSTSILPYPELSTTVTPIITDEEAEYYDEEVLTTLLNDYNSRDWLVSLINDKNIKKDKPLRNFLLKNILPTDDCDE